MYTQCFYKVLPLYTVQVYSVRILNTEKHMMSTYYYVRVSTSEQTTANQVLAMSDTYAAPTRVFDDSGVSGATPALQRPAFSEMMSLLQPGDKVIVYSISRMGRNALDVLSVIEELKKLNVSLISYTEGFDVSKKTGKMVVTILAAVAEMERETLIERTNAGIRRAQSEGVHCGRSQSEAGSEARRMLADGHTVTEVIAQTGLSKAMVYRLKKAA